ncbi:MAG: thioredoxin family protein [Clostridiales bacterium]|nr:thioredoxin family protein [Clostridiales bacterium]
MNIIRIFGSDSCEKCKTVLEFYNSESKFLKEHYKIEYIDAMSDDTQDLCDEYDVDELPHVQYICDGKVKRELVGYNEWLKSMKDFLKTLEEIL